LAAAISGFIPPPAVAEVATDQLTGVAGVDRLGLGLGLALGLALGGGSPGLRDCEVADPQPTTTKARAARPANR